MLQKNLCREYATICQGSYTTTFPRSTYLCTDIFARHFTSQVTLPLKPNKKGIPDLQSSELYPLVRVKVLWSGNPISCMNSFGTLKCVLCMKERRIILNRSNKSPESLINNRTEIYGACRHNPDFHRYCVPATAITDDRLNSEKIERNNSPISTDNSLVEICTGMDNLNLFQTVLV